MLGLCIFISLALTTHAEIESYVVGGQFAQIERYPHSAYLSVGCYTGPTRKVVYWVCGGSILNQQIVLSAAHCLYPCIKRGSSVELNLGNGNRKKGIPRSASNFVRHEKFDPSSNNCDIALVKMSKPVKFTATIGRVAIMEEPPQGEPAAIAGWGDSVGLNKTVADELLETDQNIWEFRSCLRLFNVMPKGAFCGASKKKLSYPSKGDSGAALLVRGYIQIGLVSFKIPHIAINVIVYTDTSYHYEWIQYHAKMLYCSQK